MSSSSRLTPHIMAELDREFALIVKDFRPEVGNEDHIFLAKKMGIAGKNERLMKMQKNSSSANSYRVRMYEAKRDVIRFFIHYINNKK